MLKLQLFKYSNRFPICLVRRLVLIFQKASDIIDKPGIFTKRYKNVPELTDQICDVCQRIDNHKAVPQQHRFGNQCPVNRNQNRNKINADFI